MSMWVRNGELKVQDVLMLWRQFITVSTMKQLNKLSVEEISAEFSITAENLGKRFSLRKKLRHMPQWHRYTSLKMTSAEVNKLPVNLKLTGCKVNQNMTETNQSSQCFSSHLHTIREESWLLLNLHWWFCRLENSYDLKLFRKRTISQGYI